MSRADLFAFYWKMLDKLLIQMGVPKADRPQLKKQVHVGIRTYFDVKSMSALKQDQKALWEFVQRAEVLLIREYGYIVDDNNELKFE